MKTAASNKKIREIISMLSEGKLVPNPEFQRRLIWTREDKNKFIDTILKGLPFPEIYFADGEVDTNTGLGTQLLVDGQQRVTTINQYFRGDSDFTLTLIKPYKDLSEEEKKSFLQYDVPVRDLGNITREEIVEVFKRINATKYSLRDIEINNAVFAGECKRFADLLTDHSFFKDHSIFNYSDIKRMNDLRYVLSIISGMLMGYTNRDDDLESLLERYNDDFPMEKEIHNRFEKNFDFIEECGFSDKSRIWKKSDFYSAFIELDTALNIEKNALLPSKVIGSIEPFYDDVEKKESPLAQIYYQAAIQGSNDKINRVKRGIIVGGIIRGLPKVEISRKLEPYV